MQKGSQNYLQELAGIRPLQVCLLWVTIQHIRKEIKAKFTLIARGKVLGTVRYGLVWFALAWVDGV